MFVAEAMPTSDYCLNLTGDTYRSEFSRPFDISFVLFNIVQPNDNITAICSISPVIPGWLIVCLSSGDFWVGQEVNDFFAREPKALPIIDQTSLSSEMVQ
jgi:hypothetical protein